MATLTISTTGIAPNAAANPADAHEAEALDMRRYFSPDADVVVATLSSEQALDIAYDLLNQAVTAGVISSWSVGFPAHVLAQDVRGA